MRLPFKKTKKQQGPLLVFDTHPIQYRTPVFKHLYGLDGTLKVYFFNDQFDAEKFWFHEKGKSPKEKIGQHLEQGYPNQILSLSKESVLRRYRVLEKVLKEEKPRAVLIFGYYLPEHWMLRVATRKLNIPLLFVGETFSKGEITSWRRHVKEGLTRYFFSGVSKFVSIGDKNKKYYKSWNIPSKNISEARYCVDNDFFKLSDTESKQIRGSVRQELGIPENAFVILFVGRLFSRKRPKDVLALHDRVKNFSTVHTVMIGSGEMEEEIRKETKELNNFHVLGFKKQEEIRSFYHASDVLFVPSEYETWGLVVNEAMAAGIPAIVTETCGVANDLVLPNETGFVFNKGDIAAAESFIRILITNPDRRTRISDNAKKRVTGEYTPESFAKAIFRASK